MVLGQLNMIMGLRFTGFMRMILEKVQENLPLKMEEATKVFS